MVYRYTQEANQEDLAGGRVLYHRGGMSSFPVRLGNEIFRRCVAYSKKKTDIYLYDPCCGGAYLLTVLGFLNADILGTVIGSDIDERALTLAQDNLSLLNPAGRLRRQKQLEELAAVYGKVAHREALDSLERLEALVQTGIPPQTRTFCANMLQADALHHAGFTADVIIADIPYGKLAEWMGESQVEAIGAEGTAVGRMLDALLPVCDTHTVIAVVSDKSQKIKLNSQSKLYRLDKIMIGKRKVEIFGNKRV